VGNLCANNRWAIPEYQSGPKNDIEAICSQRPPWHGKNCPPGICKRMLVAKAAAYTRRKFDSPVCQWHSHHRDPE